MEAARKQGAISPNGRIAADEYLNAIHGLNWGGDRENGWTVNGVFVHPGLRLRFEVPSGFRLFNSERNVTARGQAGARIVFDRVPRDRNGRSAADGLSPVDYLRRVWGRNVTLTGVETIAINGLDAATAATRLETRNDGTVDLRLVAIRVDPQTMYRFLFVSPTAQTAALSEPYRRTTYSFRVLSEREAAAARA